MSKTNEQHIRSVELYRRCLHLYPSSFRDRYGFEMLELFAVRAHRTTRAGGWILLLRAVTEVCWTASAEWCEHAVGQVLRTDGPESRGLSARLGYLAISLLMGVPGVTLLIYAPEIFAALIGGELTAAPETIPALMAGVGVTRVLGVMLVACAAVPLACASTLDRVRRRMVVSAYLLPVMALGTSVSWAQGTGAWDGLAGLTILYSFAAATLVAAGLLTLFVARTRRAEIA